MAGKYGYGRIRVFVGILTSAAIKLVPLFDPLAAMYIVFRVT